MDQPSQGQYKILQKLGTGGMGTVYLAMDQQLKRMVAIKVLHTNVDHDSSTFKRFLREIEVTAQLDYPHIIKIYHVQTDGEFPQLIMEFIQGKPLMDYLEQVKPTLSAQLEIIKKVALAVDYAHKKKIIHRDIKPSNIMVRNNGEPVLMDFGIAKVTKVEDKTLTRSGEIVGTLQYMSPEQATGARRDVDHRTDIYSLGAVLYHTVTGKMPLTAPSFMEMVDKIVHEEPVPLRELRPEIPVAIESICLKALAKDKEKRYATAHAFAADISNYLKGRKTTATFFVQQQKWRKMSKKIGLSLGIFATLAIVVGIILYVVAPQMIQSSQDKKLMQTLTTDYEQAQQLLQSGKIEDKTSAYQKLLHAWNLGKQQTQTQEHSSWIKKILPPLRQTGYELGVYWWQHDQDKSMVYFATLQDILSKEKNSEDIEKSYAVNAHLAYLDSDSTNFQQSFSNLLNQFKEKQKLANAYPEVVLLQAKVAYQSKSYREVLDWLKLLPTQQYQQESLYYQGMCQYHLQGFPRAEELFWAAYRVQDSKSKSMDFQYDLMLYLADSLAHQFAYQKIPMERYQPMCPILEELGRKTGDMSYEQLQHYFEMQARYYIEILRQHPERSRELGQHVLDLANRSLENDPFYAPSYLQRGFAYRYLEKFAQASEDYNYAFQLDPRQMDAITEMWNNMPYYMDVLENYVEKVNLMICRWGVKTQVTALDVCQDDFTKLRRQYHEAEKSFVHTPFSQTNFDKFYANLFLSWSDIRNRAKSVLIMMTPHEATLNALEQVIQKQDTPEASLAAAKELKKLIRKHQIREEQIHWCYLVSCTPYYGLIPLETLAYFQKQEPLLKFLRHGILEQQNAPASEMQDNWLLLQFLAARILAQLPSHNREYDRGFLYDLMNNSQQSLELRIIVAKALHDAKLDYLDYDFIEEYLARPKSEQHGKFLDIQVAFLLISLREDYRAWLVELMKTTPYDVVPMLIFYQLPEEEISFEAAQLEPLCQKALQSNDSNTRMVAVLNCGVIARYRKENPSYKINVIDIPKTLLDAVRQYQYPNIQKAALYHLMVMRNLVNEECYKELEKLLDHPDPTFKLLSISVLAGLSNPHVVNMVFNDNAELQEQIAFFYGIGSGKNTEQYAATMQQEILCTMKFLTNSNNQERRGNMFCILCYFVPCLYNYLGPSERILVDNQMQMLPMRYLKEKNEKLLFWTLVGMVGLETIADANIKLVQDIQQNMTWPLHIRKMATAVLLYAEIKKNPSGHHAMFEQMLNQIRSNLDDPDELWQLVVLASKQALRNNYSDLLSIYYMIGEVDTYQTWEYYLLQFQRNIIDPQICQRFQKALEHILAVLDLFPNKNKKQQEVWIKSLYFLTVLHLQTNNRTVAKSLLEKDTHYLDDIRLSELWISMQPGDLTKIIDHWKNIKNLSSYEQAWLVRFRAQLTLEKQDYQQSNALFFGQYILAPSDPRSLVLMADNMFQQKKFKMAITIVDHTIYLSKNSGRATWKKARMYAAQKKYDHAYQAIRQNINYTATTYPICPQDLDDPELKDMDWGNLSYYLARRAAMRAASAELMIWMEYTLKYKAPIPPDFEPNGRYGKVFDRYQRNEAFRKIWKQLQNIPKRK